MQIPADEAMLREALVRSFQVGKLKRSFMEGDRNFIGFLGEAAFQRAFPLAKSVDDFDKDFILLQHSVDVKSRIANAAIGPEFDFTLPCLKKDQKVDYYAFAAVYSHFKFVDLLGYITREQLLKAQRIAAGDPMPQGGNYRADGYRVFVKDLTKFK